MFHDAEVSTPSRPTHYRPFTPRVEPPGLRYAESPSPVLPQYRRAASASPSRARRLDASIEPRIAPTSAVTQPSLAVHQVHQGNFVSLLPHHVKAQDQAVKAQTQQEYLMARPTEPVGPLSVQTFALETQRRPTV